MPDNFTNWYTPAVYDANDNYRYTGKSHIVSDDNSKTLCGRIDTQNHFPGTGTYDTGRMGSSDDCQSCVRASNKG